MMPVQPVGFPERWGTAPLWTLFRRTARRGHESKPLLSVYRDHGVVPRGFTDDNWNRIPEDLSGYLLVRPGDLVLNKMKAWQGSLGVSQHTGIVSPAYFVYSPIRGNYEPRFLHALLRSRPFIESYGRMSGGIRVDQWDLDPWAFSRLEIPLPPLDEQRAIAEFLDRETAKIDALIEKQNTQLALLEERRSATISASFPWSSASQVQLRFLSETPIEAGLNEAASGEERSDWPRFIRTTDIATMTSLHAEGVQTVDPRSARRAQVRVGDILATRAGATIGKSYLHSTPTVAAYAGYLVRIRPKPSVKPLFLAYWMQSNDYWSQVRSGAIQSTIENFSAAKYKRLRVPVPNLQDQAQIIEHLDRETAKIDTLIAKAEEHVALAKERRAALITAAVTGQIDVTGKAA